MEIQKKYYSVFLVVCGILYTILTWRVKLDPSEIFCTPTIEPVCAKLWISMIYVSWIGS